FPRPSALLLAADKRLEADEVAGIRPWEKHLAAITTRLPALRRPNETTDLLYAGDGDDDGLVHHPEQTVSRHRRGWPKVHRGFVGSADRSMRNARSRDLLAREHN